MEGGLCCGTELIRIQIEHFADADPDPTTPELKYLSKISTETMKQETG